MSFAINVSSGERLPSVNLDDLMDAIKIKVVSANEVELENIETRKMEKKIIITGTVIEGNATRSVLGEDGQATFTMGKKKAYDRVPCAAGDEVNLWLKFTSSQAGAVAAAYQAAGADGVEAGAILGVWVAEFKDVGKQQPMKVLKAKYERPAMSLAGAGIDPNEPF